MAFGAAAVWSHGLGDRKELSASHKQDSSCTHDTQDLKRTLPGKIFKQLQLSLVPVNDLLKMNRNVDTEYAKADFHTCDCHLKVSRRFTDTLQSLDSYLIVSRG